MSRPLIPAMLVLAVSICVVAQDQQTPPPTGNTPLQQQKNAANANQDTSATSGDQITQPSAAKGSTLIGCLSGPDKDGKFALHSMQYRGGVEILGPDNLKSDSGSKVKLTGQWQPAQSPSQDKNATEMRRFQATDVEVMASTCHAPSATTPVSKEKRQKPTTYNAPSTDSPQ